MVSYNLTLPNGKMILGAPGFILPGFSFLAIFISLITGGVVIIAPILMGFKRYPSGMPLVGNCSAAISAACHPPADDKKAAESLLQWGVVNADENTQRFQHCCFTSFDVTPPVEGKCYAGLRTGEKED